MACGAVVFGLSLAGCGSGEESSPGDSGAPGIDAVLGHLPVAKGKTQTLDVTAARSELSLAPDADALDEAAYKRAQNSAEGQLFAITTGALGTIQDDYATDGKLTGAAVVLDGSQIEQVATADDSVTAIDTKQDPEEIQKGLLANGFFRRGDEFLATDANKGSTRSIAFASDGVILLSGETDAGALSTMHPEDLGGANLVAAQTTGTSRVAVVNPNPCLSGFASATSVSGGSGEVYLVTMSGPAKLSLFRHPALRSLHLGKPEIDGSTLRVSFKTTEPKLGSVPFGDAGEIYFCKSTTPAPGQIINEPPNPSSASDSPPVIPNAAGQIINEPPDPSSASDVPQDASPNAAGQIINEPPASTGK